MNVKKDIVEIMSKYAPPVIKNKKSDAALLNLHAQTWVKLSKEYNSINGVHLRYAKQLKKLWQSLKGK